MRIKLLNAEDAIRVSIAVYGIKRDEDHQLMSIPREIFDKEYDAVVGYMGVFELSGEGVTNLLIPPPFVRYVYA